MWAPDPRPQASVELGWPCPHLALQCLPLASPESSPHLYILALLGTIPTCSQSQEFQGSHRELDVDTKDSLALAHFLSMTWRAPCSILCGCQFELRQPPARGRFVRTGQRRVVCHEGAIAPRFFHGSVVILPQVWCLFSASYEPGEPTRHTGLSDWPQGHSVPNNQRLTLRLLGFLKDLISQAVRSASKAQEPHSSPWLQGWVARVATSPDSWLCHFKWGSWSIGGAVECPPASLPVLWVLCCVLVLLNTSLRPLLLAYSPLPHALTLWPLPSPFDPCPHPLPSGPCPKEALPTSLQPQPIECICLFYFLLTCWRKEYFMVINESDSNPLCIYLRLCGRYKMKYLKQSVCGWFENRRVSTMSLRKGVRYKSCLQTARVHSRLQRHFFV